VFVYLIVAPRDCDVVELADGSRTVTARGGGEALARAAEAADGELVRLQAAHREWAERLDRALDASTSAKHARLIRDEFLASNPEPQIATATDRQSRVAAASWWCARIDHPEVGFEAWLAAAGEEYPLVRVAGVLSDLGARGWELRHVGESKRVVHDDATSSAELVGARFLLERAVAAGPE
jgi:hypothetical protein